MQQMGGDGTSSPPSSGSATTAWIAKALALKMLGTLLLYALGSAVTETVEEAVKTSSRERRLTDWATYTVVLAISTFLVYMAILHYGVKIDL